MDVLWLLKFTAVAFVGATLLQRVLDKLWKRLPGPIGIPILGRLPWVLYDALFRRHGNFYQALSVDGESHGDARFLRIGTCHIVVLSTADSISEALVKQGDDFAARPTIDFFTKNRHVETITDGQSVTQGGGILLSNGELWKEHRRFALRVLRDFGMGKDLTESNIQVEIKGLTEYLSASSKQSLNPNLCLTKAVSNVICQLVFGYRMGYEDPDFERQIAVVKNFAQSLPTAVMLTFFFPILEADWLLRLTDVESYLDQDRQLMAYMSSKIQQVEADYKEESEPTNYIEAYLRERQTLLSKDSLASSFSQHQLVVSVADLFLAGTDTTSNALNWAFIYMASHPEWQAKVHDELDRELGSCAQISFADRVRCPITQAVMDEVLRHCSLVPHNVEKGILKETWFRGCRISPGTYVIADIRCAHYDPKVWPEPHRFDPTRFLNEHGSYRPSKKLIAFSIGKRSCLGESLARMEYFLFFSAVMLKFEVELDEKTKQRGGDIFLGTEGPVHAPKDHGLVFSERFAE